MLHDPRAFAYLRRRMRAPEPVRDAGTVPTVAEMLARIEAMLAARTKPQG